MVSQVIKATFEDMRYRAPSDGLLSNAEDLVKFGEAILNSEKISNQIKERLFMPAKLLGEIQTTAANSWFVQKDKYGELYYGKIGDVTGDGSVLLVIPEEKLVIAVTINLTSNEEIPVFTLFNSFLEKPEIKNTGEKQPE